jgi:hypothetical protein
MYTSGVGASGGSPVLALMRRYVTTTDGLHEPWDLLADRVRDTDVELHVLGIIYVATGTRPHERGAK